MKVTRDPALAIRRCAELLDFPVEKSQVDGKTGSRNSRFLIQVPNDPLPATPRRSWEALAFLADVMRSRKLEPTAIAFVGVVPSSGLSSWEESALKWLSGAPERPAN